MNHSRGERAATVTGSVETTIETRAVLAGAYEGGARRKHAAAQAFLTHAVQVDETTGYDVRVLCGRVNVENICDRGGNGPGETEARPTCERCATRDPRWSGRPPMEVEPRPDTGHPARVLARLLVEAIEAHVKTTGESYSALAVRAGLKRTYVNTLRDAVKANPEHAVESVTLERIAEKIGYTWKLEPPRPDKP